MAEPRQDRIDVPPAASIPNRSVTSFGQSRLGSLTLSLTDAVLQGAPVSLGCLPILPRTKADFMMACQDQWLIASLDRN
jgi:hypothetical protein